MYIGKIKRYFNLFTSHNQYLFSMFLALIPLMFVMKNNTKQRKEGRKKIFCYYSICFILFVALYIYTNFFRSTTQTFTLEQYPNLISNTTSNNNENKMEEMIQSAMLNDLKQTLQTVGKNFHDL